MSQPDQPGAGLDLSVFADLSVSVGKLTRELEAQRQRQERFNTALHIVETVPGQLTAASQTLSSPLEGLGPRTGYVWDVLSITVTSFTAGQVDVYKGRAADQNWRYSFLQPGSQDIGGGSLYLQRGDSLTFVSNSAFTGTATLSICSVEFEEWLLADYLL